MRCEVFVPETSMITKKQPTAGQYALAESKTRIPTQNPINHTLFLFIAPLTLVLATIIFYFPLISGKGYLWNDFIELNFPYRLFAAMSLKEGIFPFWNPYVFAGMPFFADIQAAVLYPFNLLLTPFVSTSNEWLSPLLVQVLVVAHIFIAGFGMYLLAREYALQPGPGIFAALTFMFCAFFTTHIFHTNLIHTAAWLPYIYLLFRRMVQLMLLKYCAIGAILLALAFFAGHPQIILYICYWLGAYYIFFLFKNIRMGTSLRKEIRRCSLVVVFFGLMIGMTSIQLLPTQELSSHSVRPILTYEASTEGSIRPYRLITFLAPDFFGNPESAYWGIAEDDVNAGRHYYWETAVYCGLLPLILATFALVFVRKPIILFLGIMTATALLLSLGDSFFLYKFFHSFLPGLNRFRIPGRLALILAISIALLSAFGFQWLIENRGAGMRQSRLKIEGALLVTALVLVLSYAVFSIGFFEQPIINFIIESGVWGTNKESIRLDFYNRAYPLCIQSLRKVLILYVISAALIILYGRRLFNSSITQIFCIAFLFFDLLLFGYGYASSPLSIEQVYKKSALVKTLQEQGQTEFFRINSRSSRPGTEDLGGSRMIFQKNQGSVHRLFLMEGFSALRLKRQLVDRKKRTLDILNVKYAIQTNEQNKAPQLVLNQSYLPRVWMAYDYLVEPDDARIKTLLHDPAFDHRRAIILEEPPSVSAHVGKKSIRWTAELTHYDLNTISIDVETDAEGFLVLSEIYYPAWKAYVDDQSVNLHRTNYALRSIPVPKGKHKVQCNYESNAFQIGKWLTITTFLIAIAILVVNIFPFFSASILGNGPKIKTKEM